MNEKIIEKAKRMVNANQGAIARAEALISTIGCEFCTNCSGIVGG